MSFQDGPVALACASAETVFLSGESGPVWRVVDGIVRLDRESGHSRQPVQLALPGDLIGIEVLCEQRYRFSATAFTDCRLQPVRLTAGDARAPLLEQALLQHQARSQDMTVLRTGAVIQRISHLMSMMGLDWPHQDSAQARHADVIRESLPPLREVAQVVDAKHETVCRALAQLLPPRSRKSGPPRVRPVTLRPLHASVAMAA